MTSLLPGQTNATAGARLPTVFGLQGDGWMRHASPASVGTRFTVLPLLAVSVWSRAWLGWWCLLPVALSIAWMFLNPRVFSRPRSTKNWASKAVLGERIWIEADRSSLPVAFRSRVPSLAQWYQALGLPFIVYGLIDFDVVATFAGVLIVLGGKLWYLDRMVLLFEDAKLSSAKYASWEY